MRLLHEVLNGIDLLAGTVDREGRIDYANPALSALTGWAIDELIGLTALDLWPAATRDETRAGFAEAMCTSALRVARRASS